jgi:hypothetical protein
MSTVPSSSASTAPLTVSTLAIPMRESFTHESD